MELAIHNKVYIKKFKLDSIIRRIDFLIELLENIIIEGNPNHGKYVNRNHRINHIKRIRKQVIEKEIFTEENKIFLNLVWNLYES